MTFARATELLREFKGDSYLNGSDVLTGLDKLADGLGETAVLVADAFPGSSAYRDQIRCALAHAGVSVRAEIAGARPNAPREDLARITEELKRLQPDVVVSFGGGSTIDAAKAAEVLRTLGGKIEDYFGTGLVTRKQETCGARLHPHLAIQTAASSGAHLTRYSNITDVANGQKKLIVDDAIVPCRAAFDYSVTLGAPPSLTVDGALDGVSHVLEVLYSATGKSYEGLLQNVAREAIRLVVEFLPGVLEKPADSVGREALGLATDLGGYAIMLGGTNGAHLTSFSLVDILSHGRACALLNPYYTVFFAPAIESPLRLVGSIFQEFGHTQTKLEDLRGRDLGMEVAGAMSAFQRQVGLPLTLAEVPGFTEAHIERALAAAKNPQLRMKLENMPVPLTPDTIDTYMAPVLKAACTGDLSLIRNV